MFFIITFILIILGFIIPLLPAPGDMNRAGFIDLDCSPFIIFLHSKNLWKESLN